LVQRTVYSSEESAQGRDHGGKTEDTVEGLGDILSYLTRKEVLRNNYDKMKISTYTNDTSDKVGGVVIGLSLASTRGGEVGKIVSGVSESNSELTDERGEIVLSDISGGNKRVCEKIQSTRSGKGADHKFPYQFEAR
jgi:Glu-tRNA(Gln) amidotransferase subunit E-like FAD-binding protein